MRTNYSWMLAAVLFGGAAAVTFADSSAPKPAPPAAPAPAHAVPPARNGGTVIELCDGETAVEVTGTLTPDKARAASATLMREWRKKNPDALWDDRPEPARAAKTTAQAPPPGRPADKVKQQSDVYGAYSSRDQRIWAEETAKFIEKGNQIFHDAKALGGTVAISCDMCHPNGANTHPETYPKFQVQLGRVALLRDMINWCVENPVKGTPFADDDPRLRALEAYILAQRKGVALDYGKH